MADIPSKADTYNEAVDRAELLEVLLESSSFKVDHEFRGEEEASDKFINQRIDEKPDYDPESQMLFGTVRFRVWMNRPEDKAEEAESADESFGSGRLSIETLYVVVFRVTGSHSSDTLSKFFERTAPFSAWPYFRSLVAQFAAASRLEIPILPIKRLSVPFKTGGDYTDVSPAERTIAPPVD
jgi:hypothetical protein